ncbi:LysM peptidoglycan-binding domain-containing protein [Aneurinibacillus terranovensis]|uniref:LysM peptidoglycan-binding domain-containing protein n=1 Tax=Aneurinibacillus terranovensis TaxID=278991 RepID=UPI0004057332|nr:LysM peptidoglycan-binding domain-containing protein [Aneurinibacillus terranovensis]
MDIWLGGMQLKEFEKPDLSQLGGKQILAKRWFPGGEISIQNLGPDYRPITWSGTFLGKEAYNRMMYIGLMRTTGKPVRFKTSKFDIPVMIEEFLPDFKTEQRIPFSITLMRVVSSQTATKKPDAVTAAANKSAVSATGQTVAVKTVKPKTYTVKPRDTLSKIAGIMLGDPDRWPEIYSKNRKVLIYGPHDIRPGWVLTL